MSRVSAFIGILALSLGTQAAAQTMPSCQPVSPYGAAVCLSWPDARKFKPPYRMVAMLPGCDGFDGAGYQGAFAAQNEGESDPDYERRVALRVAEFRKGLAQQYSERTGDFLDRGIGVLRVDFTQAEPKSAAREGKNCGNVRETEVLKGIATRLREGIGRVRLTHRRKIQDREFYVIASSLGGGGTLQLFKEWKTTKASQRPNRAVVFFPACRNDLAGWVAPVPTLMLMGSKDNVPVDYDEPTKRVFALADNCRVQALTAGANLDTREYDDTYHGFSVSGSTEPFDAELPTTPRYRFVAFAYNPKSAAEARKALLDKLK